MFKLINPFITGEFFEGGDYSGEEEKEIKLSLHLKKEEKSGKKIQVSVYLTQEQIDKVSKLSEISGQNKSYIHGEAVDYNIIYFDEDDKINQHYDKSYQLFRDKKSILGADNHDKTIRSRRKLSGTELYGQWLQLS